jgi:hypothetical protein
MQRGGSFFLSRHEQDDGYLLDRRNKIDNVGGQNALGAEEYAAEVEMLKSLNRSGRRPAKQLADMLTQLEEAFERNLLTRHQYEAAVFEIYPLIDDADWTEINKLRGRLPTDGTTAKASAA